MWNAAFKDYKFVEYSHITSNSLKALFQKFYLVYFLTLCFIFCSRFFCFQILITITNEIRITAVNVLIYYIQLRNILASLYNRLVTAWKVSKYGVISGPYFPVFGLNTKIYGVNLRIQSKYRKIRTRNNSAFGNFLSRDSLFDHSVRQRSLSFVWFHRNFISSL